VTAVPGKAQAAISITFNLTGSNSSQNSFTFTDVGSGMSRTARPVGTSTLFNRNTNGLCMFSNRDGCGIPANSGLAINSANFIFNKSVFVKSFSISATNICGIGCTPSSNAQFSSVLNGNSFGPFSFTQGQPTIGSPQVVSTGSLHVLAGSPLSFSTTVLNNPTTGFQYRISSMAVEEVPGPLPVLGAIAAFTYSRKLRQKLKINCS